MSDGIDPNIRFRPPEPNPLIDGLDDDRSSEQGGVEIDLDGYEAACLCPRCEHADICVVGRALADLLSQSIAESGTGLIGVLSGCSRFRPLKETEQERSPSD